MPPTILKQSAIEQIEIELSILQKLSDKFTPEIAAIAANVAKSKLFHLKHSIARCRRQATKALAGNEITLEMWERINRQLDGVLAEKGED